MTRMLLLVALVLAIRMVSAQTRSAGERELIDQLARCNDGWSESIARKDYALFATVCPETSEAVFWYGGDAPVRYGGPNGLWSTSSASNRSVSWRDLQPVAVQIDGDTALVYYSVVWTVQPNDGQPQQRPSRRLTVFRRHDGRWLMAGGTVAAVMN